MKRLISCMLLSLIFITLSGCTGQADTSSEDIDLFESPQPYPAYLANTTPVPGTTVSLSSTDGWGWVFYPEEDVQTEEAICFGIVLAIMATLTHGSTNVMVEVFDPLLVLAAVQKEKCTALYGVPTMFIAEYSHPMFDMFDLSSLRTGIMAGSTPPIEAMKKVVKDMHMTEITSVYGLTEGSPGFTQTSTDDPLEKRVETVGKNLPECEVKIVDPETGETLEPGQTGEICCKGYNIMKGYYKMPEKTREVIDKDGWLHSGDLATVDEEGYYSIVGRIKDMINRGGENIYPREIEEFLYTMPGILDLQVVGIPDDKYGELVGAFIILAEGTDLSEEDVRDFALTKIARYKVPKHVFFVDEFPLTASGKIQKFKLREQAVEALEKSKAQEEDIN